MQANIYSNNQSIGTADLKIGDESMGGLYGDFLPNEFYFNYIQNSVREIWGSHPPDYRKWASLKISVQLENGYFLFPAGGITIADLDSFPEEDQRIDIDGVDSHVLEDFFKTQPSRPFVEAPWEPVSIDTKIGMEKQLHLETQHFHVLNGAEISTLCRNTSNDDVLYITRTANGAQNFALVHLTWSTQQMTPGFPHVTLFESFEEFRYRSKSSDGTAPQE